MTHSVPKTKPKPKSTSVGARRDVGVSSVTRKTPVISPSPDPSTKTPTTPPDLTRRTSQDGDRNDNTIVTISPSSSSSRRDSDTTITAPTITTRTGPSREVKVNTVRDALGRQQISRATGVTDQMLGLLQRVLDLSDDNSLPEHLLDSAIALVELIEYTGSGELPQDLALTPTVPRGLTLDGQRIQMMETEQVEALKRRAKQFAGETALIAQYLIEDGSFDLSTDQLVDVLKDVKAQYWNLNSGKPTTSTDPRIVRIARQWMADDAEPDKLAEALEDENATRVTGPQARALNEFLKAYPAFLPKVWKYIKGFRFGSPNAKQWGGGLFKDGLVEIAEMTWTPPEAFRRFVVHELGHATFQRILLNEVELPLDLNEGKINHLLTRRATLRLAVGDLADAARIGSARPPRVLAGGHREPMLVELAQIEEKLDQADAAWSRMPDDAKEFYRAWQVLRKNKGEHMLGVDLGPDVPPSQRRSYQAGAFAEFCAETFMLLATAELDNHVTLVLGRDDIPPEVKEAWRTTQEIVHRYAAEVLVD